jgi:hypothetical protein
MYLIDCKQVFQEVTADPYTGSNCRPDADGATQHEKCLERDLSRRQESTLTQDVTKPIIQFVGNTAGLT